LNTVYPKMSIKKILSTYLNGCVLKSLEGNERIFDGADKLLALGYERIGSEDGHSVFEKYYSVGANKGFTFKVYFYRDIPWSTGISFWRFKLEPILALAKDHVKKIDVFFDEDNFSDGALIINDTCVCRFEFIKEKYPRVLTLETSVIAHPIMKDCKITIESVLNQFSRISQNSLGGNLKAKKIFEIMKMHKLHIS